MMSTKHVSFSQMTEWMACQYRWYLHYGEKLTPKKIAYAPTLGTAVHAAIEDLLKGGSLHEGLASWNHAAIDQLCPDGSTESGEHWLVADELAAIAREALVVATCGISDLHLSDWETLEIDGLPAVEIPLEIDVLEGFPVVAKIDWIAREVETGRIWLFDHKTRKSLTTDAYEETDLQKALYQYMLYEQYGIEVCGSISFEMLSRSPAIPRLNKDGSLSRQKITTNWDTYLAEIFRYNLDPSDYGDMREKLSTVRFSQVRRSFRSMNQVTRIFEHIVRPQAIRILTAYNHDSALPASMSREKVFPRSMTPYNCRGCAFKDLCLARLNGWDDSDILVGQFLPLQEELDDVSDLPEVSIGGTQAGID